ncbi:MAG TPA: universal stress protein [Croceibacterium sp.]|jgi:nucleotide-binding universal stress UspA family protein
MASTFMPARDDATATHSFARTDASITAMRSILLHVNNDAGMEARLQAALDLARAFDGHITCLQPISFDFAVPGDLYGTMIAELLPAMQEAADAVRDRMRARLGAEDVAWDWKQAEGPSRPLLIEAEALADLVVVGARDPASNGTGPSELAGYLAVHGRSPLLVVPETTRALDLAGPAVIGWNGSLEGAHALRAAVPLLRRASSVTLANVAEAAEESNPSLPCIDAAEYLSRHGIVSEIVEIGRGEETVAGALANAAAACGAVYLVIGAYGHTRALETVFGGVTRELFSDPPLPLFTAH